MCSFHYLLVSHDRKVEGVIIEIKMVPLIKLESGMSMCVSDCVHDSEANSIKTLDMTELKL